MHFLGALYPQPKDGGFTAQGDKGLRFGKGIVMMISLPLALFSSSGRKKLLDVFFG